VLFLLPINGSLYQVTRASDNTTSNIGVLSDGYANAACHTGTRFLCEHHLYYYPKYSINLLTINDLTPRSSGGEKGLVPVQMATISPASATALPVIAGGHKVYGCTYLIRSRVYPQ